MGVMKFFDVNFGFKAFGGLFDASSNSSSAENAFDESNTTAWQSSGEGTDGTPVYVERDFETDRVISRIFVLNSNIDDISFEY